MSRDLYETIRQTTNAALAGYSSPSPWDSEQIWSTRTDDCLHYIHPRESLAEAFRTPIAKDQHIQTLKALGPVFEKFELEVQDMVIDTRTKTVVVRLAANFDFRAVGNEGSERELTTEFMWLMEMNETGEKMKRVDEFLDQSTFLQPLAERAAKYGENQN